MSCTISNDVIIQTDLSAASTVTDYLQPCQQILFNDKLRIFQCQSFIFINNKTGLAKKQNKTKQKTKKKPKIMFSLYSFVYDFTLPPGGDVKCC